MTNPERVLNPPQEHDLQGTAIPYGQRGMCQRSPAVREGDHSSSTSLDADIANRMRSQGILAPVLASATLFGGYLLFKLFPDLNIQTALNCYFALVGTVAVTGNLQWPLRQWTGAIAMPHLPVADVGKNS